MESEDLKLKPYDRLQSILSEKDKGKLTKNASEKLDELFGSKDKETFFDKVRTRTEAEIKKWLIKTEKLGIKLK